MKGYNKVIYNNRAYYVCRYKYRDESKLFVIDEDDFDKIMNISQNWRKAGLHVGCSKKADDGTNHVYYLHKVVMSKAIKKNKGEYVIRHINTITHDNRKANLKLIPDLKQNESHMERVIKLPKKCGLSPSDIPKELLYDMSRDRFTIRLKQNGKVVYKEFLTRNKETSIKAKLEQAKMRLNKLYRLHPEFDQSDNLENYSEETIKLMEEFNDILDLSNYKCAGKNKVEIPERIKYEVDTNNFDDQEIKFVKNNIKAKNRNAISKLPEDCGVTVDMIPKYCYYKPATNEKGDRFVIDRHPGLPEGKRQLETTSSKKISTKEKFKQLLKLLKELNARNVIEV